MAADYLALEARRIGLEPAGEAGTFFQTVPLLRIAVGDSTALAVDNRPLTVWTDFAIALPTAGALPVDGSRVVFGGWTADTAVRLTHDQARRRIVVLASSRDNELTLRSYPAEHPFSAAAAIAITNVDRVFAARSRDMRDTVTILPDPRLQPAQAILILPTRIAQLLLRRPVAEAVTGDTGAIVVGRLHQLRQPARSRNVIAKLPGTDRDLRGQVVVLGAHSDHTGIAPLRFRTSNHDSLRFVLAEMRRFQALTGNPVNQTEFDAIRARSDSVAHASTPRRDSIMNGADDNASGSMSLLEIATTLRRRMPRRSILFVWHTAEELQMQGSRWFTEHPTLPIDSMVALLNLDMIGRGGPTDIGGGGPEYLQIIGARRLSAHLGNVIDSINQTRAIPFRLDYSFDAPGHRDRMYCRSDHAMYARFGIPVAFFTTGLHADYHRVTDEAKYLDYEKLAAVTSLVSEVALQLANRPDRLRPADASRNPAAACTQ